jgi:hypothetical protein
MNKLIDFTRIPISNCIVYMFVAFVVGRIFTSISLSLQLFLKFIEGNSVLRSSELNLPSQKSLFKC